MRRIATVLALMATVALPGQLQAQETDERAAETQLREMVTEEASAADRARATVLDFLSRGRVRETAEARGMDVERMKDGVATMDADAAQDLARRVREADDAEPHVGGDTFVISSTVVIIALLVLILIAVT